MRNDMSPYRTRFGIDYECKIIPFGARIEYQPSTQKGQSLLPVIGDKLPLGIFMGYGLKSGGDWDGNLLVVEKLDLQGGINIRDLYPQHQEQGGHRAEAEWEQFLSSSQGQLEATILLLPE